MGRWGGRCREERGVAGDRRQKTEDRRQKTGVAGVAGVAGVQELQNKALLVPDKPPVRFGNRGEKLECTVIGKGCNCGSG
jgi:hypothetical protein